MFIKKHAVKLAVAAVGCIALALITLGLILAGRLFLPTFTRLWHGSPLQYGAEGSDTSLLVVKNAGLYGFCDTTGKVVIRLQFEDARPFHEGLAAVERNGRYGYIDKSGQTVIPFRYYEALDFHNGKALVGTEMLPASEVNGMKCCIIDAKGNVLRETRYDYIGRYSDGMTYVSDGMKGSGYLDNDCNEVFFTPTQRTDRSKFDFREGLALFLRNDGTYCFVDKTGNLALPNKFFRADPFSEGFAAVLPDEKESMWGYIDKTGKVAIAPQYRSAGEFGEGLACVYTKEMQPIIIDASGREVCALQIPVDTFRSFSEGLCAVGRLKKVFENSNYEDDGYDWGFIDTTGKLVIDFKYDMVTPFKNGITQVLLDGKIGYIDKTGKYIWEPK